MESPTPNRRKVLAATGGLALLGAAQSASADHGTSTQHRAANFPIVHDYPTIGTHTRNPTATFYGNFASSHSQKFAKNQLHDIVDELVAPGKLNVEFRHLSANPSDPSKGYMWRNHEDERYMARVAQCTWNFSPLQFWQFFQYMMENPPEKSFSNSDAQAALKAAGVNGYKKIPNRASDGYFAASVKQTTRHAAADDIPYLPRIVIGGEQRGAGADDLIPWLESHAENGGGAGVSSPSAPSGPQPSTSVSTIMDGTKFETEVYVIDSNRSGPTGFVVGGQHGIEPAGWKAAHKLRNMTPREGKLVVVPEADKTAINGNTYGGEGGNLNRQWPQGSSLADAIWSKIQVYAPDVVLDLHSSGGIYGGSPSGVGQCIFPTPNARSDADKVISQLNSNHIKPDGYNGDHLITRGNDQTGRNPLLSHQVGKHLDAKGFLFETTRSGTNLSTRIDWTYNAALMMLRRGGVVLE